MTKTETYINSNGELACAVCGQVPPTDPCHKCAAHAARMHAEHLAQVAGSAAFAADLVSVERTAVKKGFCFVGTLANGETLTLRAVATKPYTVAAIHERSVVSKFDMPDPRGFVTFHNAAPRPAGSWDKIIRLVPIGGAA